MADDIFDPFKPVVAAQTGPLTGQVIIIATDPLTGTTSSVRFDRLYVPQLATDLANMSDSVARHELES